VAAGRARGVLSEDDERTLVRALIEVPRLMTEALALEPQIELLAHDLAQSRDVLYLGRGTSYPLALEGALKLKEISYIHAEGYAGGGPKGGAVGMDGRKEPGHRHRPLGPGVGEARSKQEGGGGGARQNLRGAHPAGRAGGTGGIPIKNLAPTHPRHSHATSL